MSERIKIQKVLHFKSVGKTKKTVSLTTNPLTQEDVARVSKMRDNLGSNKGDKTLMFGTKEGRGFSALPDPGTNYYLAFDTTQHKKNELPKVGDPITLDVFNEFTESALNTIQEEVPNLNELTGEDRRKLLMDYLHLSVPGKPVVSNKTNKPLTNCFWSYIPS